MAAGVRCSRAEAFRDGLLVDVSEVAEEMGINRPIAVTRAAWDRFVSSLSTERMRTRLLKILFTCRMALLSDPDAEEVGLIGVVALSSVPLVASLLPVKVMRGADESGEPVLTVSLLVED